MSDQKPVVFRRVRGRIVPIRLTKKSQSDLGKGAALSAAGVAVGAGSGKVYRAINREALSRAAKGTLAHERVAAFKFRPTNKTQLSLSLYARQNRAQELAMKRLNAGRKIGRFAAPVRLGGRLLSAALLGAGATKLVEGMTGKNLSSEKASAIGASVGAGAFLTGAFGGSGFRHSIKPLYKKMYPHMRKLKGLLKL